jgi:hypothetical protein
MPIEKENKIFYNQYTASEAWACPVLDFGRGFKN